MERFDFTFRKGRKPAFAEVPPDRKRRLLGVDYVHLKGRQSGELWLTRHGWEVAESLRPEHWFVGRKFSKVGRALAGATGAVYRVPVPHQGCRDFALVVKFNRFCQSVGVTVIDPNLRFTEGQINRIKSAYFLSPFAEFGNLNRLRSSAGLKIPTKTPLGIYCPPARYLDWQLGREPHLKGFHSSTLLADQAHLPAQERLDYDWERQYIMLYRWLGGIDAEDAVESGIISEEQMIELGKQARGRLKDHGWEVMDHKPRHVIIRQARNDRLIRRKGQIVWGLIDYELLYPLGNTED